jgi:hypothetical protein
VIIVLGKASVLPSEMGKLMSGRVDHDEIEAQQTNLKHLDLRPQPCGVFSSTGTTANMHGQVSNDGEYKDFQPSHWQGRFKWSKVLQQLSSHYTRRANLKASFSLTLKSQ